LVRRFIKQKEKPKCQRISQIDNGCRHILGAVNSEYGLRGVAGSGVRDVARGFGLDASAVAVTIYFPFSSTVIAPPHEFNTFYWTLFLFRIFSKTP
jgi:hypothetical protein